ncbi:VPDSG-CTERM sorting domain-containing protein [Pelagicoccus sp. NFK12]|uniref:VPDSG-CTERM sorting domain-containing protein n=1 Tax=Pelagicoccus enzymogenes TaxID=2773457 RepID=A0A927FAT5_9BACT|nr:VPDSG-CTERM sorting domain-containing protein [Pelagicoccus enzymogenes]MBD5780033.1 VPDSG-CTERM sorting domain-containing protein [Pelagicoccus enzymogenes]
MIKKLYFVAILTLAATSSQAVSISYDFTQGGYEEGAVVTGSFTAEDINTDGQIDGFSGEVSDFSMSFSGNSLVAAFDLLFVDLFSLVYDMDGTIGDGATEGMAATNFFFSFDVGASPFAPPYPLIGGIGDFFTPGASVSSELVIVTAATNSGAADVPDSGPTVALLGLGVLAIATARRRLR